MPRLRCQVILNTRGLQWTWWAGAVGGPNTTPSTMRGVDEPLKRFLLHFYHVQISQIWAYGDYLLRHPCAMRKKRRLAPPSEYSCPSWCFPWLQLHRNKVNTVKKLFASWSQGCLVMLRRWH
ncbi:hypothetical protein MRX96_036097 [Rhipicephalus microplus]